MKNILLFFLFCLLGSSHLAAQPYGKAQSAFVFNRITVGLPYAKDSMVAVQEVVPYNNGFICKLWPKDFLVYDSLFHRNQSLEKKLVNLSPKQIFFYSDTTWIVKGNRLFALNDYGDVYDEKQLPFSLSLDSFGYVIKHPLLSDSAYLVYRCCQGEFGGNISFFDKKTEKVNVFPTTCPVQAIKIKNEYHIYSALAHLSGFEEILSIKDPGQLFEDDFNQVNCDINEDCCHSFAPDSVVSNVLDKKKIQKTVINYVQDSLIIYKNGTTFIMAFEYKGNEYTLREVGSLYLLSIKERFSETIIDSVKNNKWKMNSTTIWSVVSQSKSGWLVHSDENTIIKVHGNKIEIIE